MKFIKKILCVTLILVSGAVHAQQMVRSKTVKVTSQNLVDAYYETNFYDKVTLILKFKNPNGSIEKVSGNYTMLYRGAVAKSENSEYCSGRLGKKLHYQLGDSPGDSYQACTASMDFFAQSNVSTELSAVDIVDFFSGILHNQHSDISNSSAKIAINQRVSSGDASSSNTLQAGSQASSFSKKSLLIAASQATGSSSAESSADKNALSADHNTAINSVKSCSRLFPQAVIQYTTSNSESDSNKLLSLDLRWKTILIKCP